MPRNYYRSLISLSTWHSPVILVHVLRYFQNLFCKRNWYPYHLQRPMFPTPGSTSSRSGSPMPSFTSCFTVLHVLFERCDYFNNGCVLFSISFLSLPITYFFLVCLPGITHPGWFALLPAAPLNSECRGRGGRAPLSSPPRPPLHHSTSPPPFLRFAWRQS